jgi:hypothetical protein
VIAGKSAQAFTTSNSATFSRAKAGIPRYTASTTMHRHAHDKCAAGNQRPRTKNNMEIRVAYEHSLASAPEEFIVHVPSQLVTDIPANVPRALLPEFIASLIVKRSPTIGKIRNLRILSEMFPLQ